MLTNLKKNEIFIPAKMCFIKITCLPYEFFQMFAIELSVIKCLIMIRKISITKNMLMIRLIYLLTRENNLLTINKVHKLLGIFKESGANFSD